MLRLVNISGIPVSKPVDKSGEFQPGMICQMYVRGSQIVAGVSDGTAPCGIIDDIRTVSFSSNAIDELVLVGPDKIEAIKNPQGMWVTKYDVIAPLENPNILPSTFVSRNLDVILQPKNGNIIFQAGTELNFILNENSARPDSLRTVVNYTYQVANTPGDDTTAGSSKMTMWIQKGLYQTDQFDPTANYGISQLLFVNSQGKLTTKRINEKYPGVAMVMAPPNSLNGSFLEFLWF